MFQTAPLFAALASRLLPIRMATPPVLIFSGLWTASVLLELHRARGQACYLAITVTNYGDSFLIYYPVLSY